MTRFILIVLGITAGVVLAILGNYVYDILKPSIFPPNPSRKRILAVVLFFVPIVLGLAWVNNQIDLPGTNQEAPTLEVTVAPVIETATLTTVDEIPTTIPTVTPISNLDRIHLDDFTSPTSGWDLITEPYGSSGYDNGKYFIDLSESRLFLANWEGIGDIVDNAVLEAILFR